MESLNLHETDSGVAWVEQFKLHDQPAALELLKAVRWVSAAEFVDALTKSIRKEAKSIPGPIALYIEQDLKVRNKKVERFYKQTRKPKSAYGVAIPPVRSKQAFNYEVGSEGVVGSIATGLKRKSPQKFLLHPTAQAIRKHKVRAFFVLADTVGSGQQSGDMLQSLWNVASVKSWTSLGLLQTRVIAFACTAAGQAALEKHPMHPKVIYDVPCPTIATSFDSFDAQRMVDLCDQYSPAKSGVKRMGFGDQGVLLAYAHGIPNNAPALFFKSSAKWVPLFKSRVTNPVAIEVETGLPRVPVAERLVKAEADKLAASRWLNRLDEDSKKMLLVMASLSRSPRTENAIAARTGLTLPDVRRWLEAGKHFQWISGANRLTDDGLLQLNHMKKKPKYEAAASLPWPENVVYHPTSLRAPD